MFGVIASIEVETVPNDAFMLFSEGRGSIKCPEQQLFTGKKPVAWIQIIRNPSFLLLNHSQHSQCNRLEIVCLVTPSDKARSSCIWYGLWSSKVFDTPYSKVFALLHTGVSQHWNYLHWNDRANSITLFHLEECVLKVFGALDALFFQFSPN